MSEVKFTPGPWEIFDRGRVLIMGASASSGCVAECFQHSHGEDPETVNANAHLIATAPRMYAALDALSKGGGLLPGETIEQILIDARGESQ